MVANPLLAPIEAYLLTLTHPISEYELYKALDAQQLWPSFVLEASTDEQLFKKHFLVMNALYRLAADGDYQVGISALAISLQTKAVNEPVPSEPLPEEVIPEKVKPNDRVSTVITTDQAVQPDDKLSQFYLDWHNLKTPKSTVDEWLSHFWSECMGKSQNKDTYSQALSELGLSRSASPIEIKRRYKQLANKHHPDKGGSNQAFIRLRNAYDVLIHW